MGQKDLAQNDYLNDKHRFADMCNGILFQGREVIRAEELQEADPAIIYYDDKEQLQKIIPDKICIWKGVFIRVLGLEAQTKVDYSMVLRNMKAEALSYQKQWIDKEKEYRREGFLREGEKFEWNTLGKESRIVPVIMLVIYFGTDKAWDGARCLYDMLDLDKELEPYITNYRLNIFDYHNYDDFSFFKTENRLVFETLACSDSKRKMKAFMMSKVEEYRKLDMTSKMLICDLIGFKNNIKMKEMIEGGVEMCKAIMEWEEEAVERGIEQGIGRGIEQGIEIFIQDKIEDGKSKEEIVGKLVLRFQMNDVKAKGYYDKYSHITK